MSVIVDRKYVVKDKERAYVFSQEEMQAMTTETNVIIQCAGPKCAQRNGKGTPFQVAWNEEEAKQNAEKMPDDFFRILKIVINPLQPVELPFCGPQCGKDFLTYTYQSPKSPREIAAQAKEELSERLEELNPHLVRKTDSHPGFETPDGGHVSLEEVIAPELAYRRGQEIEPVEDATGYSEGVPV